MKLNFYKNCFFIGNKSFGILQSRQYWTHIFEDIFAQRKFQQARVFSKSVVRTPNVLAECAQI